MLCGPCALPATAGEHLRVLSSSQSDAHASSRDPRAAAIAQAPPNLPIAMLPVRLRPPQGPLFKSGWSGIFVSAGPATQGRNQTECCANMKVDARNMHTLRKKNGVETVGRAHSVVACATFSTWQFPMPRGDALLCWLAGARSSALVKAWLFHRLA